MPRHISGSQNEEPRFLTVEEVHELHGIAIERFRGSAGRHRTRGDGETSAIIEALSANLTIIYEKGEDGFWVATIPEVPGAFSQGQTKQEARENVINAMQELMVARRELALRERIKGATYETLSFQS